MLHSDQNIDVDLLMALRDGDKTAFSTVFEAYYKYLYIMAIRYLMSEEDAEDAVQYTFIRLWEERKTFNYREGIKNLLFTIMRNHILNIIRHNNMVLQKKYEIAQNTERCEVVSDFEKRDFKTYFYKMLDTLPPQKQEVCRLKLEQGMSNQEIADYMHVTVATVKSHYTQALKLLRVKLKGLVVSTLFLLFSTSNLYHLQTQLFIEKDHTISLREYAQQKMIPTSITLSIN